jgi:hypothetical protein
MIGFLLPPATAAAITAAIAAAQTSRALPVTWLLVGMPVLTGEHTGLHFLPASDEILSCPLHRGMTPQDFPEFAQLLALLGGLEARVEIDPATITAPLEP